MISLTNMTNRIKVFNLSHDVYCAARGQCSCVSLVKGGKPHATSLTIPAGATLKKLPGALIAVKEIAKAIGLGELRVYHYRTWSKSKTKTETAASKPKRRKNK